MDVSLPMEVIRGKIYFIRGQKVLMDSDLAEMYGVETSNLNKAVKRNIIRFPQDFMFQLTSEEAASLRFQIGMSKPEGRGGRRYLPHAFTEQGVAVLHLPTRPPFSLPNGNNAPVPSLSGAPLPASS